MNRSIQILIWCWSTWYREQVLGVLTLTKVVVTVPLLHIAAPAFLSTHSSISFIYSFILHCIHLNMIVLLVSPVILLAIFLDFLALLQSLSLLG